MNKAKKVTHESHVGSWRVGTGETPVRDINGREWIWMWNTQTGEKAYYDKESDLFGEPVFASGVVR